MADKTCEMSGASGNAKPGRWQARTASDRDNCASGRSRNAECGNVESDRNQHLPIFFLEFSSDWKVALRQGLCGWTKTD